MNAKTIGRVTGGAILLTAGAIVGYALLSAGTQRSNSSSNSTPDSLGQLDAPPAGSVADLPEQGGAVQDLVALADDAAWTRIDPLTGELRYKMEWAHLEPEDNGLFEIDSPHAWIYERDRTIEVTAHGGQILWPSRDREPESGRLEGDVIIVVHRAGVSAQSNPSNTPPPAEPELTIRTNEVNFNTTFGELATKEPVSLVGNGVEASGTGLTLRFAPDRAVPLTYVRIESDGHVLFDESEQHSGTSNETTSTPHTTSPKASQQTAEADTPVDTGSAPDATSSVAYYRAEFVGGVHVQSVAQVMEGESVLVWARMIDGRLAPNAIGAWDSDNAQSSGQRGADQKQSTGQATPSQRMELTWKGPMELRLQPDEPEELKNDDVFLRVRSPGGKPVRVIDAASGASVQCLTLDYAATRRLVTLMGIGPLGVTFTLPELVEVIAGRFELDLTTGIGAIATAGIAQANQDSAALGSTASARERGPRELRWNDRADFRLDTTTGPVGSGGKVLPREIIFTGRVEARDGLASLQGQSVRAILSEPTGADQQPVTLQRLIVDGDAAAEDSDGGRVAADSMDVLFEPAADSGRPIPTIATAQGDVQASRGDQSLSAGMIELTFKKPDANNDAVRVESFEARLGVEVSFPQQQPQRDAGQVAALPATIEIFADRLNASNSTRLVELTGEPARLARKSARARSEITGPSIRLDAAVDRNMLTVFGAGNATHASRTGSNTQYQQFTAQWQNSMTYDDSAGRAELDGDTVATADVGDDERHVARGAHMTINLLAVEGGGKQLDRAVIEGTAKRPAEVELRRYLDAPDKDGIRPLEGLAFLQGPEIQFAAHQGTLVVPGAGLLLIEDRRAQPIDDERLGEIRGTTLFEWDGMLSFDRESGKGTMTNRARMRHRDLVSGMVTQLECERLNAHAQWPRDSAEGQGVKLTSVRATGAVFVQRDTLQMLCDELDYNAAAGLIRAWANEGNRITLFDETDGRNVFAGAIELDVSTGKWGRISRPTGALVPR